MHTPTVATELWEGQWPMVSALIWSEWSGTITLVGDIVLCSRARHFTLTMFLFTQVYKWVTETVTETGISSGLISHLARMQTLPFTFYM